MLESWWVKCHHTKQSLWPFNRNQSYFSNSFLKKIIFTSTNWISHHLKLELHLQIPIYKPPGLLLVHLVLKKQLLCIFQKFKELYNSLCKLYFYVWSSYAHITLGWKHIIGANLSMKCIFSTFLLFKGQLFCSFHLLFWKTHKWIFDTRP
jgi:hypothetical protein